MDDEIDVRRYLQSLLNHWRLIVALTLIAAVAAAGASLLIPNVYEAVALISISVPRYTIQWNAVSQSSVLPVHAYPELAESGDIVAELFTQAQSFLPPGTNDPSRLTGSLSAETASDPTLLRLKVRDGNAQRAARLANLWADVFAARASQLYSQDQANLAVNTQELATAKDHLAQTNGDLAAFQSGNQVNILTAQLASQQATLTGYLNRQHQLELLTQDIHDLLGRLNGLPAASPASLADDLALLSVANQLYGNQQGQSGVPLQVQIGAGQTLVGPTVADQRALAQNLSDTVAVRAGDVKTQVSAVEPQILALQGQLAQAGVKEAELTRTRDLAASLYTQLATQVQQATIAVQASSSTIQIASRAPVPARPISQHRLNNVLLGGALGFVLGVLLSLGLEFWRPTPSQAGQPGALARPGVPEPAGRPHASAAKPVEPDQRV